MKRPRAAEQYRSLIKRLGLTQVDAAHFFKVSMRTSQNWASEGPPFVVKALLTLLIKHGISAEQFNQLMGKRQ